VIKLEAASYELRAVSKTAFLARSSKLIARSFLLFLPLEPTISYTISFWMGVAGAVHIQHYTEAIAA
jgi:hypothetical protein